MKQSSFANFCNKNLYSFLIFLFTAHLLCAEIFIDGTGGFGLDFYPPQSSNGNAAELKLQAFYATQFQINKNFLINGNFAINTDNIFQGGFFNNTPSYFNINELSASYCFDADVMSGQVGAFLGNFEAPGTGSFVKKYLGVNDIIPDILYPHLSLQGTHIYPINGVGLAFGSKFQAPIALGTYLYFGINPEWSTTNTSVHHYYINNEYRIAAVTDNFMIDFAAGLSLPLRTEIQDSELHVITKVDFHAGTTMVIGGNPFTNLFLQAGLQRIQVSPANGSQVISLDDLYVVFEPRFATRHVRCAFTLYCIPQDQADKLQYIDKPVGASLTLASMPTMLFNVPGEAGGIISASIPNPVTTPFSVKNLEVQASPYMILTLGSGDLDTRLFIYPLRYTDIGSMFKLSVGYVIRL